MQYINLAILVISPAFIAQQLHEHIEGQKLSPLTRLAMTISYGALILFLNLLVIYLRGWGTSTLNSLFFDPNIQVYLKYLLLTSVFTVTMPHVFLLMKSIHTHLLERIHGKK